MKKHTTKSEARRHFYATDPWHNFKSKFISNLYSWVIENIEQFPELIRKQKRLSIEHDMGLSSNHDTSISSIVYDYFCEYIQDNIETEIMGIAIPPEIANTAFDELIKLTNDPETYLINYVPEQFYTDKIMSSLPVYPINLNQLR